MSSAEIARQLGNISSRTVTNRIDALIGHNIINICSIINPEKIGYGVLADVFIEVEPGNLRNVAEHLAGLPQVSYVACATGDTDIIICVRARSIGELYNFVIETIGNIPCVRHTQTFPQHHNIKDITTWMPPDLLSIDESENSAQDPESD